MLEIGQRALSLSARLHARSHSLKLVSITTIYNSI